MISHQAVQDLPTYLTVSEVAKLLKLNPLTIYAYIQKGELSAIKFGRYYRVSAQDLDLFIKTKMVSGHQ